MNEISSLPGIVHTLFFLVSIALSGLIRRVVLYVKNDILFEELIAYFISNICIIIFCIIILIIIMLKNDDILLIELCYIGLCSLVFANTEIKSKVDTDSEKMANDNSITNKARNQVFNNTDQKVIPKSDINNQ